MFEPVNFSLVWVRVYTCVEFAAAGWFISIMARISLNSLTNNSFKTLKLFLICLRLFSFSLKLLSKLYFIQLISWFFLLISFLISSLYLIKFSIVTYSTSDESTATPSHLEPSNCFKSRIICPNDISWWILGLKISQFLA